jgi:ADP-heptose:LPS heptosyltransferase
LQALLPQAKLCALVTPANELLARSLGIFDDVFLADLVYSHTTKRRYMQLDRQISLRQRLEPMKFDLAIDLSPGSDSRPLLKLAGARYTVGFKPHDFPWLTFGIDAITRDPVNRRERASHQTLVMTLVEAFGAVLNNRSIVVPRQDIDRSHLQRFGIIGQFAVLHCGARLQIKRWPIAHYVELARLIVAGSDLQVVMLSDDPGDQDVLNKANLPESRVHFVQGHVSFDELEALIGFCSVFVGNDTGPKHFAALRGAPVVSVHMGQVNWDEWGQEGDGLIVSRRVPCCGCGIEDVEDCGKDLACLTNIKPEEIFSAVVSVLRKGMSNPRM